MNIEKFEEILKSEPRYRTKQAKEAVFKLLIDDWSKASFLPLDLREKLNKFCPLSINAETLISKNKDSVKARITLEDDIKIESVLMRHENRNTVCVSSQAGCSLNCKFCATGQAGFKRDLKTMEIVEQVIFFGRILKNEEKRVSNVVFMGMGEPFLNYENVIKTINILNDKDGLNIGARHISVSTAGIVEGIRKFSEDKNQVNLAISLHAPNNEIRKTIMPISKKYSLEDVLEAVDDYIKKTKKQVMFEYILLDGINDSKTCALELAKIMRKKLYFLNLILYNPTGVFKRTTTTKVNAFKATLKKEGIRFSERYRFGQDIKAACGQFANPSIAFTE